MMEVALVFDREGKTLYWHEPPGRTAGHLPDSEALWAVLWENRDRLGGVAHSHPWSGLAQPSRTDLSTFDAVERGLGRQLLWVVVTMDDVAYIARTRRQDDFCYVRPDFVLEGLAELRARSQH
jgi:hypothetical protein